ncbi:FecR domain-containing protein [Xanthomonas campestris pv. phormiicola]|nr:FecR domain-containing protein [Xanthomonas campestris pv. phormiicola]UYC17392.1 FecR domain-containing protein [Xanthomonas campestris pv. phormiicola]
MSDVVRLRSLVEVEEEAAVWVWRLDDEAITSEFQTEFEAWLRRDPRHRRAFEELGGVWKALDELAEAKRDEKVATFVAEERRLYTPPSKRKRGKLRVISSWALVASLTLAAVIYMWRQRDNESQTLATAVGQHRSATLADGSVVELNTNTILETNFSRGQRVIHLRKGEATFQVAHNPERPFLVHAGDIVVRAVGTQFNVRVRDALDVEVIVTEGRVEVKPTAATPAPRARAGASQTAVPATRALVAGQRYDAISQAAPVDSIAPAAVANTLAWRQGAIVFDGEPLAQALAEFNRYSDTRLVVADASIRDLRVGGRFRTGDVEGFLDALSRTFPIATRKGADNLIYVQARTAPSNRQ